MKIVIITLGCKVNQYESDALAEVLVKAGHQVSCELEFADAFILNTCAVTNEAERKSRQMISKFNKLNPNAKIFVCGCASQNNFKQFSSLKNVQFIKGNASKLKLIENLDILKSENIEDLPKIYEPMFISNSKNRRAFVKIQDGCNRFCSYCIIPYVRGRSRSRDIESIVDEVETLIKNQVKEIVLTGIDISDYKIKEKPAINLLLKELRRFNVRIRMSSVEVGLITDELLLNLKKLQNFCPHFHLSMQSGSDGVLKRMNRNYSVSDFLTAVEKIRKVFPDCAITTDIIVGFPGETEKEFQETFDTVKKIEFAFMHIFPFSRRSGTAVDKILNLKNNKEYFLVGSDIIKQRSQILRKINNETFKNFNEKQIGKTCEVVVEELVDDFYVGHSRNFTKVYISKENQPDLINEVKNVKLESIFKDGVLGKIS